MGCACGTVPYVRLRESSCRISAGTSTCRDCYDSTSSDLRSGPWSGGLRSGHRGDVDNSNNLKFLHARYRELTPVRYRESVRRGTAGSNNKIDFISSERGTSHGRCRMRALGSTEMSRWSSSAAYTIDHPQQRSTGELSSVDVTTQPGEIVDLQFLTSASTRTAIAGAIRRPCVRWRRDSRGFQSARSRFLRSDRVGWNDIRPRLISI